MTNVLIQGHFSLRTKSQHFRRHLNIYVPISVLMCGIQSKIKVISINLLFFLFQKFLQIKYLREFLLFANNSIHLILRDLPQFYFLELPIFWHRCRRHGHGSHIMQRRRNNGSSKIKVFVVTLKV